MNQKCKGWTWGAGSGSGLGYGGCPRIGFLTPPPPHYGAFRPITLRKTSVKEELHHIIINQEWSLFETQNFQGKCLVVSQEGSWSQGWPWPQSTWSGTINILQVWLQGWGVSYKLTSMLESWNLAHKSRITYNRDLWCQARLYYPSIQSDTINVLQIGPLENVVFAKI